MSNVANILSELGIGPTPVRLLVYKFLDRSITPLSLSDLETGLDTIDKSTISRTLALFKQHHLLHCFNDGSGSVKYELCRSHHHDVDDDKHVHFRCEICGETKCLKELEIPLVDLPKGYKVNDITYVISGVCADCQEINKVRQKI